VRLGFGIPAARDPERSAQLAREVERLGFSTLWTNDIPKASGLATARYIADASSGIRVGVGVLPCDRNPAPRVASEVRSRELPLGRMVLGLGAGSSRRPIQAVRSSVNDLRREFGEELKIGVGAMGPRMCRLAGEVADLVLLNWMVPERVSWAQHHIKDGSSDAGRPQSPEVVGYVRVAMGKGAIERIRSEAERYYAMPAYGRHFEAMGEELASVGINADDEDLHSRLTAYAEVLDEVVIRALPRMDSLESTLEVAEATAPVRWL
jgi:alkanesulfonate monooxygenase SsuD/methylene tetrahydromethanopterin reductase-like flavin-dependent oxidoreductase (luciferase family)